MKEFIFPVKVVQSNLTRSDRTLLKRKPLQIGLLGTACVMAGLPV